MKQHSFIPILIVILVIAAALGGGFLVTRPPQQISQPSPTPDVSSKSDGCKPTGCSSQICSDEDVVTTCEYRAEYACYKNAKCERQPNGKCGWTNTPELQACLKNPPPL